MEFMATKNDLGEICLTGDFNARTGSENHELDHSKESEINFDWINNDQSHPVISKRTSKDKVLNKRWKLFLIHLLVQTYPSLKDVLSEMYSANTHMQTITEECG